MSQKRVVIDRFDNYQEALAAEESLEGDGHTYQIRKQSRGFVLVRREINKASNENPKSEHYKPRRGKKSKTSWEGDFEWR